MDVAQRIPLAVAGVVAAVGLFLGLRGPPDTAAPAPPSAGLAPVSSAAPAPSVTASAAPPTTYEPDLTGEDVGTTVVALAETVSGLAVAGGQLAWLLTAPASLGVARADGAEAETLWRADGEAKFGAELVALGDRVAWSVESTEATDRAVFLAPTPVQGGSWTEIPRPAAPEHLATMGGELVWSELGSIVRRGDGSPEVLARRKGRIASLAADEDTIYFVEEALLGGGERGLFRVGEERRVERVGATRGQAGDLLVVGDRLVWTEADGDDGPFRWMHVAKAGGTPSRLARCGLVTARATDGRRLSWAEAHGEEPVVTLLRTIDPARPKSLTRLGRDTGLTTALAVRGPEIYWAAEDGIQRLRSAPSDAAAP